MFGPAFAEIIGDSPCFMQGWLRYSPLDDFDLVESLELFLPRPVVINPLWEVNIKVLDFLPTASHRGAK